MTIIGTFIIIHLKPSTVFDTKNINIIIYFLYNTSASMNEQTNEVPLLSELDPAFLQMFESCDEEW